MKSIIAFLVLCLFFLPSLGWAASKSHSFRLKTKVIHNGKPRYEQRIHTYSFRMKVLSDDEGSKRELTVLNKYSFIEAVYEERYSVRLHNPLPVRVAVNLSIDGLNAITGRPCTPEDGRKWMIEPRSYITVKGWQVNKNSLRRFYFTSKRESYAAWRSNQWGSDLTVNCGMISAAYFWNRKELERYFEYHPIIERGYGDDDGIGLTQRDSKRSMDNDAGTGMGEKEHNPIRSIDFQYDMGMYSSRQTVKIYYDFDIFSSRRALDKYKEKTLRGNDDDEEEEEENTGGYADEPDDYGKKYGKKDDYDKDDYDNDDDDDDDEY